jgi:hypothetical protein
MNETSGDPDQMSIYTQLHHALKAFMASAKSRDTKSIATGLARIRELGERLPPDAPPMLRHYLDRRSYQKALELLTTDELDINLPPGGER